jgi:DNA repair protein RadC
LRLREGFLAGEAASRTDEALLELLLTFAIPRYDVQPLTKTLLARFGSLSKVLAADQSALRAVEGVEARVSTLLKLADSICQATGVPHLASAVQDLAGPVAALGPLPPDHPAAGGVTSVALAQSEMLLNLPGQSELSLAQKEPTTRERKTIQDVLITEGLLALTIAHEATSPEQLQEILMKRLGQNSAETRRRYARSILKWFFPDGLDGLLPRAWRAYENDAITTDLLRWSYLSQEPIMGRCVTEALFPCENGLAIPATYFDKFLQDCLGEPAPEKTRERLKINLKRVGFLERAKGKPDRLVPVVTQKTSLLILVHHLFAAKAVRTVELRHLFANPFWKLLGYKSEDAVRAVLREADAKGLIGKYVVADQLEQVTTCFTSDEVLERKARL